MLFSDVEIKEIGEDILKTIVICIMIAVMPLGLILLLGFFFG